MRIHQVLNHRVLLRQHNPLPRRRTILQRLQEARDDLGIEDYAVSQTSLEQVFLQFAKQQGQKRESLAHRYSSSSNAGDTGTRAAPATSITEI